MPEPPLTRAQALRLADKCVRVQRPLGWTGVRLLLETLAEQQARLVAAGEEVAALNRALARKRGRGVAGEPR